MRLPPPHKAFDNLRCQIRLLDRRVDELELSTIDDRALARDEAAQDYQRDRTVGIVVVVALLAFFIGMAVGSAGYGFS